ncbi:hypothetical protein FQR65_LT20398 [Abscondita terminalis]|nr:hypothetical protein FQR65_LT20398 [Abscondita terminalis]
MQRGAGRAAGARRSRAGQTGWVAHAAGGSRFKCGGGGPASICKFGGQDLSKASGPALEDCAAHGSEFAIEFEYLPHRCSSFAAEVACQGIRMTGSSDLLPSGAPVTQLSYVNPEVGLDAGVNDQDLCLNYSAAGYTRPWSHLAPQQLQDVPGAVVQGGAPEVTTDAVFARNRAEPVRTHSVFAGRPQAAPPGCSWIWPAASARTAQASRVGGFGTQSVLDITRQKYEVESALRQAKEAAEQAERAKADFPGQHEPRDTHADELGGWV